MGNVNIKLAATCFTPKSATSANTNTYDGHSGFAFDVSGAFKQLTDSVRILRPS